MTEEQWLACDSGYDMLEFVQTKKPSDRKFRLFAVACFRYWQLWQQEHSAVLIDLGERLADSAAVDADFRAAAAHASDGMADPAMAVAALDGYSAAIWTASEVAGLGYRKPEELADLVRCIFGPLPFHGGWMYSAWRTPTVLELAREIYDGRKYDLMPVLGAALSDAGCTEISILEHCGGPGPHVKGCHVVDLLLAKE